MPAAGAPTIRIHGARTHNLKDLSLELPRGAWTVVCGVSGSGKSSLVLDTLGAESRRRFLGTLRRAGHALEGLPRPDVDRIEGLPPAVTAGFASRRPGVRATLGTVTEVTHALRALFMRAAVPHCPACGRPVDATTREAVTAALLTAPDGTRLVLAAPRGTGPGTLEDAAREGFVRVRVDGGAIERIEEIASAHVGPDARIDVVVDRLVVKPAAADRFAASVDQAFALGAGRLVALRLGADGTTSEQAYADRPWCSSCDVTYPPLSTGLFSFNSPVGACPACEGRGGEDGAVCADCDGARLGPYPRAARLDGETLPGLEGLDVSALLAWLARLALPDALQVLTQPAREDALARLGFLAEVGLGYLTPARAANTLSGGELRRAQLASACAARMSGLLFLLDEPTAGLHPADRPVLRERLRALVEDGNTVVCVEHDLDMLRHADWMVELGPKAGAQGGRLLAQGPAGEVLAAGAAPTAVALGADVKPARAQPRDDKAWVTLGGARLRNLDGVACQFPARGLTAVTGVSGAGKSTLALDVLAPAARAALAGEPLPPVLDRAAGFDAFDRVVRAGSSAARHARATAGSVLKVLTPLRTLFAETLEARARGWSAAWFSTHVDGGRCSACKGTGRRTVLLRDLPEHRIPCDVCGGSRFRADVERVRVKGYAMADVLRLTLEEAALIFRDLPRVRAPLDAACAVGLGYVPLGESTARLSGGEALRLHLAAALGRSGGRTRTLYVLDEPCAGLHPADVEHLAGVLLRLTERGNAVVAVEHHVGLVRVADHVVELGPGPGADGGRVVYEGPPAGLAGAPGAATAPFL